ncbi:hypothetical protein A8L34_05555 [Bacillus sp. FJAT-27264]|uniref:hypothetical protein n=1 Tax=Paenibacillus sp. (strain DSM 101736 / FJAT-27264) TaxID=1850362 RepID=UPI000807A7AA|nr:hypothetical protein [Bacillus sp. FJAT-27264]OBZ19010.1 hypothetical protein A8L34_05555 [Bacillus sp. FJAT-27264]
MAGNNGNSKKNNTDGTVETGELSAEDYAIIGAGLTALGDFFAFLSLVKAREVTQETGGQSDLLPLAIIRSYKKATAAARQKARPRKRR